MDSNAFPTREGGGTGIPKESLPHDAPIRKPQTLLDRGDRLEGCTALITRMLGQYLVDIAAMSETRFAEETLLEEVDGGYTYCIVKPENAPRTSGDRFTICAKVARQLDSLPRGINLRLMTLRL